MDYMILVNQSHPLPEDWEKSLQTVTVVNSVGDEVVVEKKTYDGYPLRVEYSITQRRGKKMIEAIDILQMIGVDYMVERGLTDSLVDKGILSAQEIEMIKGGNEEDIKCLIAKYFS